MNYAAIIKEAADAYHLNPVLFCALCMHESVGLQQWATRYEPAFFNRHFRNTITTANLAGYKSKKCSLPTELTLRSTSFGLSQVLGETARVLGFRGEFLTELLDPVNSLTYGAAYLARCFARAKTIKDPDLCTRQALLNYNGGGNEDYPDLVLQHWPDACAYMSVAASR